MDWMDHIVLLEQAVQVSLDGGVTTV
jgi:hypothetical protein